MTLTFGLISKKYENLRNKLTQIGKLYHLKYVACVWMIVKTLLHFLS